MKKILFSLITMMSLSSFASKEIMQDATKKLKATGIEKSAVNAGVKVPAFKLGGKDISEIYKDGPVVLKFYRGGWCPYCMKELKDYQSLSTEFENAGCRILGISPDLKKEIAKTKKKHDLSFDIYRDQDNRIAKKFGLAFKLDKRLLPIYKNYGIVLEDRQGNKNNELPLPGTYVVDRTGKITYAFLDVDYTKRAAAADVLKECKKIK
jgi:peroxiredoxin